MGLQELQNIRANVIDLTGRKFNRLYVIGLGISKEKHRLYWLCQCDCGVQKVIRGDGLKSGKVISCGCYNKEIVIKTHTTHGQGRPNHHTPEYNAWQSMIRRCYYKKGIQYKNYGGRGIKVCKRWLNSFENFFSDMGVKLSTDHSLDRFPNNDGDYKPSNCGGPLEHNK